MITMKEMQELDSVLTKIDLCIAKQEAQNASTLESYQEGLTMLSNFKDCRRSVNRFLNSVTIDVETVHDHASLIEGAQS